MATFYTVIQFVPDPVADERQRRGSRFRRRPSPCPFREKLGPSSALRQQGRLFLKQFARDLEDRIQDGPTSSRVTEATLRDMAANWRNAIQFTTPRGSLLSLEKLLEDAEGRFLASDRVPGSQPFTRRFMKKLAFDATCQAFVQRGGERARRYVKRNFSINGAITAHPFSLAIANRTPCVAAEVFSFVGSSERSQEKGVMATAFAFEDVQKQHREIDLVALVLTGDESPTVSVDAMKVFGSLRARVVPKDQVDDWADEVARRILRTRIDLQIVLLARFPCPSVPSVDDSSSDVARRL